MIQAHYSIARLPEPPLSDRACVQSSGVRSLAGHRRRKRSEIAVAIDQCCINIYDIHSNRLLTSYNVAPQIAFTCPPCSLRLGRANSVGSRRMTYCSISSNGPTIQLFEQSYGLDYDVKSTRISVRQPSKPIILLDAFSNVTRPDSNQEVVLVAVHEDGEVRCYTEQLDRELWAEKGVLDDQLEGSVRVKYACIVPTMEAQKALLKGREDLVGSFTGTSDENPGTVLLLLTQSCRDGRLTFRLINLDLSQSTPQNTIRRERRKLQHISSLVISHPSERTMKEPMISFHVASGTLYQYTSTNLLIFDLTGFTAQAGKVMPIGNGAVSSCIRISQSLISVTQGNAVSILDLRYNSYQGYVTLPKRKRPQQSEIALRDGKQQGARSQMLDLISYNSALDLIVAIRGRELLAFQLDTSLNSRPSSETRKRKRDGLLIDCIGHGAVAPKRRLMPARVSNKVQCTGYSVFSETVEDSWTEQRTFVDRCLVDGNVSELEHLLSQNAAAMKLTSNSATNASNTSRTTHNPRHVRYVISKIFEVENDGSVQSHTTNEARRSLRVSESVKDIPSWLFSEGHITDSQVEVALKHERPSHRHERTKVGSVARALAQKDPTLQLLLSYLESPVPFTAMETLHILRGAIVRRHPSSSASDTKLLTGLEDQSDKKPSGDANVDHDMSVADLKSDTDFVIERILRQASKKLSACPNLEVSNALRNTLSRTETRSLVDMLRIELARNGWLTPYTEDNPYHKAQGFQEDIQISTIAHLLNCAVDSMGSACWVMSSSLADDLLETAETIAHMKAEVSAALEGIEEATYLKGLLGEMLLCTKSVQDKPSNIFKKPSEVSKRGSSTIVSLDDGEKNPLPLGLKVQQSISEFRVGAGGELKRRSARDVGRLKSRTVPRYSFERIMI